MATSHDRKQIPARTQRGLFKATDRRCSHCNRPLDIEGGTHHIGEMAHIVPHSLNGPRRDAARPEDIDGIDNLMLLCSSCHRTMDKEPKLWPVERMLARKAEHEWWVAVEHTRPEPIKPQDDGPAGFGDEVEVAVEAAVAVVKYRTVGEPEEERSADGDAVASSAFALAPNGDHVWIRGVAARRPDQEILVRRARLMAEAEILDEMLPGLPALIAASFGDESAVLVTGVPSFTTMAEFYGERGREPEYVRVLGTGIAGLCIGLASLHARGLAHGDLGPDSILVDRSGALFLRDIGLALPDRAAAAEDLRRLAEVVHLMATGQAPIQLVSAAVLNPAVPRRFADGLDRALSPEPAGRGGIVEFAAALCP